jgi:hypothetical protein
MSKRSILADTLNEVQQIREAIEKNANHVLKSTLKEELEEIIHKGLDEMGDEEQDENIEDMNPDSTDGMDLDSEMGSDSEEMTDEPGIEGTPSDEIPGDEVIDLTDKSDEEVLKRFELMEPTDEIEVIRTGDGIEIKFHPEGSEEKPGEMSPEMDHEAGEEEDEAGEEEDEMAPAMDEASEEEDESMKEASEEDEGVMYEIEIAEGDEEEDEAVKEAKGEEEDESTMDEFMMRGKKMELKHSNTPQNQAEGLQEKLVNTRKKLQTLVAENKKIKQELDAFKTLKESFVSNEKEYKNAIKVLKTQLQEVSLFTTNLTYAVKLMTENTTTKEEKFQILSTLDKAKTLNESQNIATTLEEQFKSKKSTSAATILENKVLDKPAFSSTSASINESTVYKNPQVERMKDLINKIQ